MKQTGRLLKVNHLESENNFYVINQIHGYRFIFVGTCLKNISLRLCELESDKQYH